MAVGALLAVVTLIGILVPAMRAARLDPMQALRMPVAALPLAIAPAAAQGQVDAGALEGAWRMVTSETLLPDGSTAPGSPLESLILFSGGHYSMGWAVGTESTFNRQRFRPTTSEKLTRYDQLVVNAGRYEVEGDGLIILPDFALVPEFVGGRGIFEWEITGDRLTLVWTDIFSADGVRDPATARGFRWRYTLERIR